MGRGEARQDGVASVGEPSIKVSLGPPCLSPSRWVEVLSLRKRRVPGGEEVRMIGSLCWSC